MGRTRLCGRAGMDFFDRNSEAAARGARAEDFFLETTVGLAAIDVWMRNEYKEADEPYRPGFFAGTLAPFFRASLSPMAMACLRLVTFLPLRPERSVPFFSRWRALCTVSCAFFEYF